MKEIVLKVEGMMCSGCENRVKNSLKNLDGVNDVLANHETNTVKIIANDEVIDKEIIEHIEDIGYKVVGEN